MDGIVGQKIGMTSIFDDEGRNIACNVIEELPNFVTQVKTEKSDGYNAIQVCFGERKAKNIASGMIGHLKKAGVSSALRSLEFRN